MDTNSNIKANIVSVDNLLKIEKLQIPTYQRPYLWKEKNVRQLLEDVKTSMDAGKKYYRIGSVILYDNKEENAYDIVDGQQRITTLLLLCTYRKSNEHYCKPKFSIESYDTIKQNHTFIGEWLDENIGNDKDKDEFIQYVLKSCDFVKIEVNNLTEAFQMFDSQNGRGKELESYNLLKAFHIRAMEQESREEKIKCDRRWENATQYDPTPKIKDDPNIDILKQIFDEQLYRSRIWSRTDKAEKFTKQKLLEFKGFTIDKNNPAMFPYQNSQLLQYLTSKFYETILSSTSATKNRFENGDNDHINPFVNVNQQIINGKNFFDYVETYVEIYKEMFINIQTYKLSEFKEFYYAYCLDYNWKPEDEKKAKEKRKENFSFSPKWPASRTGDSYLREAYKSLVFVLFDKFGEKGLNKYYKPLYRLIYSNRLSKRQVKYSFVSTLPSKYFKIIVEAKDLADLMKLNNLAQNINIQVELPDNKFKNEQIKDFIING